jgi:hypothetical protein
MQSGRFPGWLRLSCRSAEPVASSGRAFHALPATTAVVQCADSPSHRPARQIASPRPSGHWVGWPVGVTHPAWRRRPAARSADRSVICEAERRRGTGRQPGRPGPGAGHAAGAPDYAPCLVRPGACSLEQLRLSEPAHSHREYLHASSFQDSTGSLQTRFNESLKSDLRSTCRSAGPLKAQLPGTVASCACLRFLPYRYLPPARNR